MLNLNKDISVAIVDTMLESQFLRILLWLWTKFWQATVDWVTASESVLSDI